MKRMKTKILLILSLFSINLNANSLLSNTLRFEDEIPSICGIIFKNRLGITFKEEIVKFYSDVTLYSNSPNDDLIYLKINKLIKTQNLRDISNNDIYLVFDNSNKIRLSKILNGAISIKRGEHTVHLEIDKLKSHLYSGTARIEFEILTICK